ncbi:unnamed protein product [Peniophora sp. CBMAI 1063]|nr:unnamed protein product [Peniophora sp. CBMAI 1063]
MTQTTSSPTLNGIAYFVLPIGRIDLDALRLIFEYIAEADRPNSEHPIADSWPRLGHVCRVWRSTLLDMPQLWARDVLAFGTGSALDDVVDRTRELPLRLDCLSHTLDELSMERIIPLIPRAQALQCELKTYEELKDVLNSIASHPPKALRTLSISLEMGLNSWFISQSPSYTSCIELLPLRHLEMTGVYPNPPLLGTLTSWTMKSTDVILVDPRLPIEVIVNVLAHNTGLESLCLMDAISVFRDQNIVLPDIVVLPKLKSLYIWQESNASPCPILNRLQLPNPTLEKYWIRDCDVDTAADVSAEFASALSACACSPVLRSGRFLRVQCETRWENKVIVQLHRQYRVPEGPEHPDNMPFHVEYQPFHLAVSFLELSNAILAPLSRTSLPEQVLELWWSVFEEDAQVASYWDTVLQPFQAVTTLIILDVYTHTQAALVAMSAALTRTRDDGSLLLPCLNRLVMRAYEMDGLGLFRDHSLLKKRKDMGVPISKVLFLDIDSPNMNGSEQDDEFDGEVKKQMQDVATELDAGLESHISWEVVNGQRRIQGTEFVFKY